MSWRTSARRNGAPRRRCCRAGAQIAVLAGDPTKAVPYTVRLKFPANYDIPAHSHPTDENVVVVSGELFMGMGTKLDKKAGLGLGVGGFALMPANVNHFAYTKGETTIVLYGQGPVEFKYVNPADDPRTTSRTGKHMESGPANKDQGARTRNEGQRTRDEGQGL